MRVAFLHLDLSGGPEARNLELLHQAIDLAAQQGAKWVVTPETAVQGYFFKLKAEAAREPLNIPVQPCPGLDGIRCLAAKRGLTVFLGCAEQDEATGNYFNSCLVIGPGGEILGRHRKLRAHGTGAEGWAARGKQLEPVDCREMKAGVLVCADLWYPEHAQVLQAKGARVIVALAAWPPGKCGPGDSWEQASAASGLPVWVCNQTGNGEHLDFSQATSAVAAEGRLQLTYKGLAPAVLLFDWDESEQRLLSSEFTVVKL
ncbi:MAG TPA: carbon-nitrogen hydrolase family protein [Methylomusa anaerophila]|uniref:(R)-stereoselective amidase n=1 Tax=Methylomusa anaerophila TaxID=1930071 RepID=A0A348AM79_9FIRM|nr:carbon-nitrogen hydrolase family protein [Methylomusa anaerophila]BBB92177.1 (R)-stereoselective amidase [Methylomusa anaerophila]HML87809.1 carbon-nitrogen hydrolase family protein [Methylomusa anaerophila]